MSAREKLIDFTDGIAMAPTQRLELLDLIYKMGTECWIDGLRNRNRILKSGNVSESAFRKYEVSMIVSPVSQDAA